MRANEIHTYLTYREGMSMAHRIADSRGMTLEEVLREAREGRGPLWREYGWRMGLVQRALEAREELIEANAGLVRYYLGRHGVPPEWYEDLFQAGMTGLARALEKYDPARAEFSTYAMMWIRQAVQREMGRLIPGLGFSYKERSRVLALKAGAEPRDEEEEALLRASHTLSLDEPIPDTEGLFVADVVADPSPTPEDLALDRAEAKRLARELSRLGRAGEAVALWTGLKGGYPHTEKEVARALGLEPEEVEEVLLEGLEAARGILFPAPEPIAGGEEAVVPW